MTIFDELIKKLTEVDKIIQERQKELHKRKKKNEICWKSIEKKLNKTQGSERSNAFNILACFSLTDTPMGVSFYNKCIDELTEDERKLIVGY